MTEETASDRLEAHYEKPIGFLRDLDGILHACAEGDPGAIPVYMHPVRDPSLHEMHKSPKPGTETAREQPPYPKDRREVA